MFETEPSKSISIRQIFDVIKYYLNDIWKKWHLILVVSLIGAGIMWYKAAKSPLHYEAYLSFMVKKTGGGAVGMDNVLSQIGWGDARSNTNLEKVKATLFSKSVLKEALYDTVVINGERNLLVNHIYEVYFLQGQKKAFSKFEADKKYIDTSRAQNIAFNSVLSLVRGGDKKGNVVTVRLIDDIDQIEIKVRTINEELSYHLVRQVYSNLSKFMTEDETSNTSKTINSLKLEADSVGRLLKAKEYQLAKARDRNYGIILSKNQVNQEQIRRDIDILSNVYAQMRSNLELTKFGFENNEDLFDVLEKPVLPLNRREKSRVIYALIGFAACMIGLILIIVIRRFLVDELSKEE